LTVVDFPDGSSVLACNPDTVIAFLAEIDVVEDQHRLGGGDAIWNIVIEMNLEGVMVPRTLSNESPDAVFMNIHSFPNATQGFVTAGPN
jgi:hypothetical protein